MGSKTPEILHSFHNLFLAVLIILAVLFLLCLIRAVIGPRVADRIMAINMMGTMVIAAIIYAMISFLAVIIISKVYMGVYLERKKKGEKGNGDS